MAPLNMKCVAYAMTSLGASMMNSVFYFYYVKVFLNYYHVSEAWFHVSQVVFMIWNAVNDPLFGYIQDNMNFSWVKSRRHSILYGAPFYAISFILPWFAWGDYSSGGGWLGGLQLMFSLCFFDTTFTFVLLAQCALFAELSTKHEDRVALVRYAQVASMIGSSSVFFCEYISLNLQIFIYFQITCVIIGIIAWLCMRYTGLHSSTDFDLIREEMDDPTSAVHAASQASIVKQTLQIFSHRSFISFVLVNFCQIYHSNWLSNFAKIIFDHLYAEVYFSPFTRSVYYGLMNFIPQLVVICGSAYISKVGYFKVLRVSFLLVICLGFLMYFFRNFQTPLVVFFLIDSVLCSSSFSLFNLCLSDIIDADVSKFNRQYPLSSMVFGINALITKPAVSLAPMVTVAYLNRHGYESLRMEGLSNMTSSSTVELSSAMYDTIVYTPLLIGILQTIIWSFYTIRNSHITEAKADYLAGKTD